MLQEADIILDKPVDLRRKMLEILMSLAQAIRCCRHEQAFCEDVTFHQFIILDAVAEAKRLKLPDLHDILSAKKSTTIRFVGPLIRKELVRRDKADHDSRAVRLRLTEKGRDIHGKVWVCLDEHVAAVIEKTPE
jgi:DNA-binding MarR family transcriptional regulator